MSSLNKINTLNKKSLLKTQFFSNNGFWKIDIILSEQDDLSHSFKFNVYQHDSVIWSIHFIENAFGKNNLHLSYIWFEPIYQRQGLWKEVLLNTLFLLKNHNKLYSTFTADCISQASAKFLFSIFW